MLHVLKARFLTRTAALTPRREETSQGDGRVPAFSELARSAARMSCLPSSTTRRAGLAAGWRLRALGLLTIGVLPLGARVATGAERCVASVLNRSVDVSADAPWVLRNVPANIGRVRVRMTCVEQGQTRSGQSAFFLVPPNGVVDAPGIQFAVAAPVPAQLRLSAPETALRTVGQRVNIQTIATYPGGQSADVSTSATGTNYTSSNPQIASVDESGVVTAHSSGTILITALNDGATALLRLPVVLSGDTDGDGIADDVEIANGLNPNDPVDALEDFDRDGLTNRQELQLGTDVRNADSDADGLTDGREMTLGTDPLVFDTDGDGLGDGLEVATGSDPLDPNSYNLAQALQFVEVTPSSVTLVVNTVIGEASRPLRVTGHLTDGRTLDLTRRSRGTNYASSDLLIVNFGAVDGQVFAGNSGSAIVTVSNSGFSATVPVEVSTFAPRSLSLLSIGADARRVDVAGNYAFVSAAAGLVVVDVTDHAAPSIATTLPLPGGAGRDVKLVGSLAYVAAGTAGLRIVDVTDPLHPGVLGSLALPGSAEDLVVRGARAYVAASGKLQIVDVTDPAAPRLLGTYAPPANVLAADASGNVAVVALGPGGIRAVDVSNPGSPVALGSLGTTNAQDVVVEGTVAYLADNTGSLRTIDISDPAMPRLLAATPGPLGGYLLSLAKQGNLTFGADIFFVNGVPITDVGDPANPAVRARLDFPGDTTGVGVVADDRYVYLVGSDGFLYVGQYVGQLTDEMGVPPSVTITAPTEGAVSMAGAIVSVHAEATDDVGVASVVFSVNGVPVFADSASPFDFSYRIPVGVSAVTFGARAKDFGDTGAEAPAVTIAVVPDPPPAVSWVSPTAGAAPMENAVITLEAVVTDNGSVSQVRFVANGVVVATLASPPYRTTYRVPVGLSSFDLLVEATDDLAQTTPLSRAIAVTPDPPPSVTLTSPPEGAVVPENTLVALAASAADNVSVAGVRFLVNDVPAGTSASAPYQAVHFTPAGVASFHVALEATDNLGRTTRVERTVAVTPDPGPVVTITSPSPDGSLPAGQSIVIAANVVDNGVVADVAFLVNGAAVTTMTSPPYQTAYRVPDDAISLEIVVRATDNLGHVGEAQIEVAVAQPPRSLVVEPLTMDFSTGLGLGAQGLASHSFARGGSRKSKVERLRTKAMPGSKKGASAPPRPLRFEEALWGASERPVYTARESGLEVAVQSGEVVLSRTGGTEDLVRLEFEGAPTDARIVATEPLPGLSHYLIGSDRTKWRTGVKGYGAIRIQSLYPGVSAVFYGRDGQLEYDLVLSPGADPRAIRLAFRGSRGLRVDERGDLRIDLGHGEILHRRPWAYQENRGVRRPVEASYVALGADRFGIRVVDYDPKLALVIDPVLDYSTYLGGAGSDAALAVAVDASGFSYVVGRTTSADLPVAGGVQLVSGGAQDAFLTKFDPSGTLVYSSFFGGSTFDQAQGVAVDAQGQAHVFGYTTSNNFPLSGALQSSMRGSNDTFVAKFAPAGDSLVYSTYFGGGSSEIPGGIALGTDGSAYIAGLTNSTDFPTVGAIQAVPGGFGDAFVAKLSVDGSAVLYSTYLGGARDDQVQAIAVDASGSAYVTGYTVSTNFPTASAFESQRHPIGAPQANLTQDAFVAKLAPDGASLVYSTYLGGDGFDTANGIGVDSAGNAVVVGGTDSPNFPLQSPLQSPPSGAFVTKLAPNGSSLVYSMKLGRGEARAVALDAAGNPYVTGNTSSTSFPLKDPIQATLRGVNDLFVSKLAADGSTFRYSTYLGGSGSDDGYGIGVDASGAAVVVGVTQSTNFPTTPGALQFLRSGAEDAFVARIGNRERFTFSAPSFAAAEGGGEAAITVTRHDERDQITTVDYAISNGTATAPFDYAAVSGTLTFDPGVTGQTFGIPLVLDGVVEGDETVQLFLLNPGNGATLGSAAATLTIVDSDIAPAPGEFTQAFQVRDRFLATGPDWTASANVPWLTLSSSSGFGPSLVGVTADPAGLEVGIHAGEITVTSSEGSPLVIAVRLSVLGSDFVVEPSTLDFFEPDCESATSPGSVSTIGGDGTAGYGGDGGPATEASIDHPTSVAVGAGGSVFFIDSGNFRVRRIAADGTVSTVAGNGTQGYSGDGGPAVDAQISDANGIAVDAAGSLYIGDSGNNVVRLVAPAGTITTVAGTGSPGFSGDDGAAASAELNFPIGVAIDVSDDLLIADAGNNRIRKVSGGVITTIAGTGTPGHSGDGGPAVEAELSFPVSVAVDGSGFVYVADAGNTVVRVIEASGFIFPFAGTGQAGYGGDGGPAPDALLGDPASVSVGPQGEVYIADADNNRIRKVEDGIITTVAGSGMAGDGGDGGGALAAQLNQPWWAAVSSSGELFVADYENHRIRKVIPATGLLQGSVSIHTVDGGPGPSWQASVDVPWITLSESSGIGPSSVTFVIDPFTIPCFDFVQGTITFTASGSLVTKTVIVYVQKGQGG